MDLKELYRTIDNPLTDDTIDKLIDIYADNRGNVYNGITYYYSKSIPEYNNSVINSRDKDEFYSNCFNTWKKSVLGMSRAEFESLSAQGYYGNDFIKLRNYLKNVPDIHSYSEMFDLFYRDGAPEDIQELFEKYNWIAKSFHHTWTHFKSKYMFANRTSSTKVEHRLYINTDSRCLYKIMNLFMKKCLKRQIPFYFKYILDEGFRDDTIPIYSDSEHLLDYIEILKEIKLENPDIDFYEPPILTGKIDGFIGYGSEPDPKVLGRRDSFNNLRADLIEKTINHYRDEWIKSHFNTNFGTKGRPKTLTHIITIRAVNNYVEEKLQQYDSYIRQELNRRKSGQGDLSKTVEQAVYERCHYNPQIIKSVDFRNRLFQALYKIIENYLHTKNDFSMDIDINGIKCHYSGYYLSRTLYKFTSEINRIDPRFREKVKEGIRINCSQYGIIPDKFCFDYTRVQSMKDVYKAMKEAERQRIVSEPINSSYTPLTDQEIEDARKKIGTYVEPKPLLNKEDMMRIIFGNSSGINIKNDKKF